MRFTHTTLPQRVHFGTGEAAADVAAELETLDAVRPLVIGARTELSRRLTPAHLDAVFQTEVVQHVPVALAEATRTLTVAAGVDAIVAVGGGSAIGLAKAVALTSGLPVVAVPTTYAGSEVTDVWGLTENGRKRTGTDPAALPVAVVYDATLTVTLPTAMAVVSGLNAVAHAVDALWAPRADPLNRVVALEAIRALHAGLTAIVADAADVAAGERTLFGCWLAATAFASAGAALHHKICHGLGGSFDLPHAETHAVVLPHVLAFNAADAPGATRRIADALGVDDAVAGLAAWCGDLGAPRSLRSLGLAEADLDRVVEVVLPTVPPSNPRPVDAAALRELLHDAWSGEPS